MQGRLCTELVARIALNRQRITDFFRLFLDQSSNGDFVFLDEALLKGADLREVFIDLTLENIVDDVFRFAFELLPENILFRFDGFSRNLIAAQVFRCSGGDMQGQVFSQLLVDRIVDGFGFFAAEFHRASAFAGSRSTPRPVA